MAAEDRNRAMFAAYADMVARYVGPFFKGNGTQVQQFENHAFQWLDVISSQVIAGHPRWLTRSRTTDRGKSEAVAIRYGLNRWSVDVGLKKTLRKLFVDLAFRRACALIRNRPAPGNDMGLPNGPAQRPDVVRLSLMQYLYDTMVSEYSERRWEGHKSIWDLEVLLEHGEDHPKEGWRLDVLRRLEPGAGQDKMEEIRPKREQAAERPEVLLYEVYVAEEQTRDDLGPKDGFNGTIHTYAYADEGTLTGQRPATAKKTRRSFLERDREGSRDNQDIGTGGFLEVRDPRPAFCPPWGFYVFGGMHYVPDEAEPLSQFVAIEAELRALNVRSSTIHEAFAAYKNLLLVRNRDSSLPHKIKNGRHNHVIPVNGYQRGDADSFEVGGPTDTMFAMHRFDQEGFQRRTGLSDAGQGFTNPDVTATADTIAAGGFNSRTNHVRDVWGDFLVDIGRTSAWCMYMDDDVLFPLGEDAAKELGMKEPWFAGGQSPDHSFEDCELDIDPISMVRVDEARNQALALQQANLLKDVAMAMPTTPFVDWPEVMNDIGEAFGRPEWGERINYQMAQQMGALGIHQTLAEIAAAGGDPNSKGRKQPRLAGDQGGTRNGGGGAGSKPIGGGYGGKSQSAAPKQQQKAKPSMPGRSSGGKARGKAAAGASK